MRKFKSIFYPHWIGTSPAKDLPSNIKFNSSYLSAKKTKDNQNELQDYEEVEVPSAHKKSINELHIKKNSQSETVNSQLSANQSPDKSSSPKQLAK